MDAPSSRAVDEPQPAKDLLRFITCGSVDDGKSTLIGRLLHDSKLIFEDQLAALARDSARHGTTGDEIDFALLVDGLEAEREQGITIDVAYRFFTTPRRSFIVADTPGHEQYTRNMATGASNAELAVILIDARKGVLVQTRRHSLHLLAARHSPRRPRGQQDRSRRVSRKETFDRIVGDYTTFAAQLGFASIVPIPISARFGDNVIEPSANTPWYRGPALLRLSRDDRCRRARRAGQAVPFSGAMGQPAEPRFPRLCGHGRCRADHGRRPRRRRGLRAATRGSNEIVTYDGALARRRAGDAVTITLADERRHRARRRPGRADRTARGVRPVRRASDLDGRGAADAGPLLPGARSAPRRCRSRSRRSNTRSTSTPASISPPRRSASTTSRSAISRPRRRSRSTPTRQTGKTGAFIIIDRFTNRTVGAGMIAFGAAPRAPTSTGSRC